MKFWVVSDTHIGHRRMMEYCGREEGHDDAICECCAIIQPEDVYIHLGDVCWYKDEAQHEQLFMYNDAKTKILVRGNHDHKSLTWYLEHGWDIVVDRFDLELYGAKCIFTHIPMAERVEGCINIHGHLHNNEPERHGVKLVEGFHKLVHLEDNPGPQDLKYIINGR